MRRLLTGYAGYFIRRHHRHGHLFQNRYKSFLCQEEAYLLELVRYIHLNPLRANLVEDIKALDHYPYSGHSAVAGEVKRDWQQVDDVLAFFGKNKSEAWQNYRRFIENGVEQGRRSDLTGGGLLRSVGGLVALNELKKTSERVKSDERILGDNDFVEAVLQKANEALENRYKLKAEGYDLNRVARRVARVLNIAPEIVREKSRRPMVVHAKSLLCFWASKEVGIRMTDIASWLDITQPAVSIAARRGEKIAMENGYRLLED